jgi:putative DNA primase/helicase
VRVTEQNDVNTASLNRTDTRNGSEFAQDHGRCVRYVPSWGWLRYDGKRWARADYEEMMQLAKSTARRMLQDASEIDDDDKRRKQIEHALSSEEVPGLRRMLEAAQSEPSILCGIDDFDIEPLWLNCSNGVLDLMTGILLEHGPDLHLTKLAPVEFDPAATCPTWEKFLSEILPDDIRLYLQRVFGYCLSGKTTEQCLFFWIGGGANGKTTALNMLHNMLGDYAQPVRAATLTRRSGDGIPNDVARLQGIRLGVVSEFDESKPVDEAFVKAATGNDKLSARFLHQEFFDFYPEFKLIVTTNENPVIKGTNNGIWRRLRIVPFSVTIPHEKQDHRLSDIDLSKNILWAERSGILNWMLQGCMDWQKYGLQEPPEMHEALQKYRDSQDVLGQFLKDCCDTHYDASVESSELYAAYVEWCRRNGNRPFSQKNWSPKIVGRGYEKGQDPETRRAIFRGLELSEAFRRDGQTLVVFP